MLKSLKILNIFLLLAFSSGSFWHQSDGVIYKDGLEFIIRGIVWFGNEGPDRAPGGLWSSHLDNSNTVLHSISWFMQKIKDLGFNSLRITLSPQSLSSDDITYPTASWAKNSDPSLTNGLAVLSSMLNEAFNVGLFVVLDYTTCSDSLTGNSQPGDPTMCSGYSLNDWIADLTKLVKLTKKYPNIIGVEILSEPHSISWKTWKLYAEKALSQIYPVNPNILYFVKGTDEKIPEGSDWPCWAGSLSNVDSDPVVPRGVPLNKIVYGVNVFFGCSLDYYEYFGKFNRGDFTVYIGEFGYKSTLSDHNEKFIPRFFDSLRTSKIRNFFYWSFNQNDEQGFLDNSDSSWCTVRLENLNRFKELGVFPKSYITDVNPPSIC